MKYQEFESKEEADAFWARAKPYGISYYKREWHKPCPLTMYFIELTDDCPFGKEFKINLVR